MSVVPDGATLDAGTGAFSWTPPAGTTPVLTRALIDEGSSYKASSTKIAEGKDWSNPRLTATFGFHNDFNADPGSTTYSNTVDFLKDLKVYKFTLMKHGALTKWSYGRLINTV